MKRVSVCLFVLFIGFQINIYAQEAVVAASGSAITVQSGSSMYIGGGMSLADNTILINDGSITLDKSEKGMADFTDHNANTYSYGNGKFVFTGSGIQHILSTNRFNQIVVNNAGLDLLSDVQSNDWLLGSGIINTHGFYVIAASANIDALQADLSNDRFTRSWINGNLRRYIDPVNINSYIFPVGDAKKMNMAEMDNLSADPLRGVQYINASFVPRPGNDGGLNINMPNKTCVAVNNAGVWHLETDAASSDGHYNLKLYLNGFSGPGNNEFMIIQRPNASGNAADWVLPAGKDPQIVGTTERYASKNDISVFGQFGIGLITMVSPVISYTETKKDNSLKVYPNPVINNEFYVQYTGAKVNSLILVAADGKKVACIFNQQKSGQLKVNLPVFLAKGIYTLQLDTDSGLRSKLISLQ